MLTMTKRSPVITVREVILTMTKKSSVISQRSDADNDKKVTSHKADREVMLTMTKRSPVITQSEK